MHFSPAARPPRRQAARNGRSRAKRGANGVSASMRTANGVSREQAEAGSGERGVPSTTHRPSSRLGTYLPSRISASRAPQKRTVRLADQLRRTHQKIALRPRRSFSPWRTERARRARDPVESTRGPLSERSEDMSPSDRERVEGFRGSSTEIVAVNCSTVRWRACQGSLSNRFGRVTMDTFPLSTRPIQVQTSSLANHLRKK